MIIKEEWIKLENNLAEELKESDISSREEKYTEVYEKLYTAFTEEKRKQMSDNYLKAATEIEKTFLTKIIGKDKLVLDIGCGFGHLSYITASNRNKVIGIDINRIHIQEAKGKYRNVDNLRFYETKGVILNFPDNSFDFVVSTSVFEHLHPDDVNTHLSEVKRVLKKYGEYIFTAITPHSRGDVSIFSESVTQRNKHGFHINEKTWKEFLVLLRVHDLKGKTNILPGKIERHIPFLLLIPVAFKAWLEDKITINNFTLKMFKLGGVFIVGQKI